MSDEESAVFLNDYSILEWERPLKRGYMRMSIEYNGQTDLVSQVDFQSVDFEVGDFRVVGSATIYEADIVHLQGKGIKRLGEVDLSLQRRRFLYSGNVVVYKKGIVPGTEFEGYDLISQGKVWLASDEHEGLEKLLGGEDASVERVEGIIEGYEQQERDKDKAESEARHRDWERGARSGAWRQRRGYPV